MYKITNTSQDRTKTLLHRTTPKWDPEPFFDGRRLRHGESRVISDEHYERCKNTIGEWVKGGIVSVEPLASEPKPKKVQVKVPESPLPPKKPFLETPLITVVGEAVVNTAAAAKIDFVESPPSEEVVKTEEAPRRGRPKKSNNE